MQDIDLYTVAKFARSILEDITPIALRYFYDSFYTTKEINYKEDKSPVTIADKEIEYLLRTKISEQYPQHAIIGEEFGNTMSAKHRYAWIIDPIDGTQAFIHGTPLFTTLLALFDFDSMSPLMGCILLPIYKRIIYAIKDIGIWDGDTALQSDIYQQYYASSLYLSYDWAKVYRKAPLLMQNIFNDTTILTRTWADAYAYYLLSITKAQLIIDPDTHVWDIAAVYPIIQESKGIICDWQGNAIDWQNFIETNKKDVIACSDTNILSSILDLF